MPGHADRLRPILDALFTSAAGNPHKLVRRDDIVKAGVPRQYAESISRATKKVVEADDATRAAEDWATYIGGELDTADSMGTDPAVLAANLPRY
jgi:hypothetical protein